MPDRRAFLSGLFLTALEHVRDPARLAASLPPPPRGRTLVLAAGKAAAEMAHTVETVREGALGGVAVTPPGYELPLKRVEPLVAGHPVPDERSVAAAQRFLAEAHRLTEDDLALVLLSGGGSALLALPAPGLTLADKQGVTQALFAAGADIGEINTVRKHLSAIKGGRLACAAAPARVVTLAVSDVAGDDPSVIASGPTIGDATTAEQAAAILRRRGIEVSRRIYDWLARPEAETPKPGDPGMAADFRVIASAGDALDAAASFARSRGFAVHNLGGLVCGEAREVAREHADRARALAARSGRHLLLSGGEVTVSLGAAGSGPGGPNQEFALALALHLDGLSGIAALAADTDGIDGTGPAAGAFVEPDTLRRARQAELDPQAMLDAHASGAFFERIGDSFVTGPTKTNVNDFRAIVVDDGAIDA